MKNYAIHEFSMMQDAISATMGGIHTTQLVMPHIQNKQLSAIAQKQLQFMQQEYTQLVGLLNQQNAAGGQPYKAPSQFSPKYGVQASQPHAPHQSVQQLEDRDLSALLLGAMKSSAGIKFYAALECADPQWRSALQQCAINCSEMCYELWQFMNQNGFYQIPTLQPQMQQTIIQSYAAQLQQ
jgi:spore coat protein CotF